MPQLIWTTDKNGNLNYFNQAFYDYSGLKFTNSRKQRLDVDRSSG